MQYDRTRIAIRERSGLDILDLALHVFRNHAGPLALAIAAGAVPMLLLNYWLLGPFEASDFAERAWAAVVLSLIELPIATAPITLYLGQALFIERPLARDIVRDFFRALPQLILFQLVLRALLIIPLFFPYVIWPYLSEIILLERNPLVSRKRNELSTMKRNSSLHESQGGLIAWGARVIMMLALAGLLIVAVWFTLWFLVSMLSGSWDFRTSAIALGLEVSFWIVAGYFTVVRFLGYLDLRIRREGWEVELLLRAQRDRMMRQLA